MPTGSKDVHKDEAKAAMENVQGVSSDMATLQALGFQTMAGMGTNWIEVLGDMGSEVVSFVADRIKEDVKTQHKMMNCKDMNELQEIQTEFVKTAVEQYTAETGKLADMSQKLFRVPTRDDVES